MAGIPVVGKYRGNSLGRGELDGLEKQEEFHEVVVDGRRGSLDDKHVRASNVLLDLACDLAISELATSQSHKRTPRAAGNAFPSLGFALPIRALIT